ncbi:MAG: hypothetical protein JKX79_08200 [Labilibaculum sp.]|nr:hypothetical protein [Labilibaculum sp.]
MKRYKPELGLFILFLLVAFSIQTKAAVKLPRLVSDGMVLQRDEPLKIWGWADPSEKVKVEFLDKSYQTQADKKGNWQLELPATSAGGPYSMKVNEIEISDILIGDVWLASGQSNMELPLRRVMDLYADEINQINNTNIRLFRSSSRKDHESAQTDNLDGSWLSATPENIMEFSAVAYFYADELYRKYHVPVGIISTAIGGSPAESWLSEGKVTKYLDDWKTTQAQLDSIRIKRKAEEKDEKPFNWSVEINKNDPGVSSWSKADVDVSDWPTMSIPGYWSDKGVELKNGSIWFCKEFEVADSLIDTDAILRLGRIINSDSAFVNGTFVGAVSYQYPPRIYNLPKNVLKSGKNKLMVRVFSKGGRGGFVEEKPYDLRIGSEVIDLTGDWKYHVGAVLHPPFRQGGLSFMPGGLYNGLISPVIGYGLKGVIWYQGESNAGRGREYRRLFKDLIRDWRTQFARPELPFLFVQLANLGIPGKQPVESGWAELRDSQRRALDLPYTGMAVACDIGEWNDIHPLNKKEVGRRLALEAERVAYGDTALVSSGPLYESMKPEGNSIILTFKSIGSGLFPNSLLNGFQITGSDGQFVWAKAVVLSENKVRVWSKTIEKPIAVRYAWSNNPAESNLKNKEGLPASPFTTNE